MMKTALLGVALLAAPLGNAYAGPAQHADSTAVPYENFLAFSTDSRPNAARPIEENSYYVWGDHQFTR